MVFQHLNILMAFENQIYPQRNCIRSNSATAKIRMHSSAKSSPFACDPCSGYYRGNSIFALFSGGFFTSKELFAALRTPAYVCAVWSRWNRNITAVEVGEFSQISWHLVHDKFQKVSPISGTFYVEPWHFECIEPNQTTQHLSLPLQKLQ